MDKKLQRSSENSVLFGVCGGLANYFNIDVTIVRLLFIVFALMGGPGLLVYIVLLVIMPKSDETEKFKNM
ncbi:MAG: PspC domain-containing protein [Anaerolineae bacterium]|jgi:phage shock protein PspC (stress-responsive transcriptional regulator)|nr:PspC domain-containing protein [Anaerolineae bacterium]